MWGKGTTLGVHQLRPLQTEAKREHHNEAGTLAPSWIVIVGSTAALQTLVALKHLQWVLTAGKFHSRLIFDSTYTFAFGQNRFG